MFEKNKFLKISDVEYFAADALNHSTAKNVDKSAAFAKFDREQSKEPSDSMKFGSLVHCMMLEPENVVERFLRAPEGDRRGNAVKIAWADMQAANPNHTLIAPKDYDKAGKVVEHLLRKKAVTKLLDKVVATEEAIFFDRLGTKCKAKIDTRTCNGVLVDLKTCKDASKEGFGKSCGDYGYYTQAEWYLYSAQLADASYDSFAFIAVEHEGWIDSMVYYVPPHILDYARAVNNRRCEIWGSCEEADYYPGYSDVWQDLELPGWVLKRMED